MAVGGWWRLAVGGWWRLAIGGRLAVGSWWRLAVPGGLSLTKKKLGGLQDRPGGASGGHDLELDGDGRQGRQRLVGAVEDDGLAADDVDGAEGLIQLLHGRGGARQQRRAGVGDARALGAAVVEAVEGEAVHVEGPVRLVGDRDVGRGAAELRGVDPPEDHLPPVRAAPLQVELEHRRRDLVLVDEGLRTAGRGRGPGPAARSATGVGGGGGAGTHGKGWGPGGGYAGGWRRLPKRLGAVTVGYKCLPSGGQWLGIGWPWRGGGPFPPSLSVGEACGGGGCPPPPPSAASRARTASMGEHQQKLVLKPRVLRDGTNRDCVVVIVRPSHSYAPPPPPPSALRPNIPRNSLHVGLDYFWARAGRSMRNREGG